MKLDSIEKLDYPLFESIFINALNTQAPRKVIMTRSRWKNAYLKTRNSKDWENYKKCLHKLTQKNKK